MCRFQNTFEHMKPTSSSRKSDQNSNNDTNLCHKLPPFRRISLFVTRLIMWRRNFFFPVYMSAPFFSCCSFWFEANFCVSVCYDLLVMLFFEIPFDFYSNMRVAWCDNNLKDCFDWLDQWTFSDKILLWFVLSEMEDGTLRIYALNAIDLKWWWVSFMTT